MNLEFGPVIFDFRFDAALDSVYLDKLVRAAAPPATLRYDAWPRRVKSAFEVVIGPVANGPAEPRYAEDQRGLSFNARGIAARLDTTSCDVTISPDLLPGEMVDLLILVLAAAGVAVMLEEELGVILHASTSAQGGLAWTFPAPHETGKSTVADLLDADLKISDDLTALVRGPKGPWRAGGTNATGTGTLPIGGLLFLRRSDSSRLGPVLKTSEALRFAIRNAVLFPGSPTLSARLMDRLTGIVSKVPCRLMDFSLKDLDQTLFRRLTCPTT